MDSLQSSRICGGNTAYRREKQDFYPTPPEVTQALLAFLAIQPGSVIWEPACGDGHMQNVLEERGYHVIGTDILSGTDFLTADLPEGTDWIITNPPFSRSEEFIRRCAEHGKPFALLLKSQYWHAQRRLELFHRLPPFYILPLTWRPDFLFGSRGKGSPLMDVMWCVWNASGWNPCGTSCYIPLSKYRKEE